MPNPYNDLIEIFREEGTFNYNPSFYFATILSDYPNLKVKFDDIEIEKKMLLIDSVLLKQLTTDILKKGDRVVLLRDGEKFVILSKVVSL